MKKILSRVAFSRHDNGKGAVISQASPCTTEERLQRIEALGERIAGYVRFMCAPGNLGGTSTEAKERAVVAFYEEMVLVERQLGKIQEELQLE